jgi:hypothetical protein
MYLKKMYRKSTKEKEDRSFPILLLGKERLLGRTKEKRMSTCDFLRSRLLEIIRDHKGRAVWSIMEYWPTGTRTLRLLKYCLFPRME